MLDQTVCSFTQVSNWIHGTRGRVNIGDSGGRFLTCRAGVLAAVLHIIFRYFKSSSGLFLLNNSYREIQFTFVLHSCAFSRHESLETCP